MERNTLLVLKGWLGVSRGGVGGKGLEEETSGSCYYSPVSFCISYNVWFCLFAFCYHNVSLLVWHYESFIFSRNFILFSELILFKSVILRLSKQAVLIYRLGGPLGLDSLCSR